jgi:hypothetical protein
MQTEQVLRFLRMYVDAAPSSEYALANDLDHPPSVYLREDHLTGPVDTWLAEVFHPDHIEHSLTMLEQVQPDTTPALGTARSTLSGLDQKLNKYRAALEAGTDPAVVATWIKEVQDQREVITAQIAALEAARGTQRQLSKKEIERLIEAFGGLTPVLHTAEPGEKQEVYRRLGVKLTFNHTTRTVEAEAIPQPPVGVVVVSGGGPEHWIRAVLHTFGAHAATVHVPTPTPLPCSSAPFCFRRESRMWLPGDRHQRLHEVDKGCLGADLEATQIFRRRPCRAVSSVRRRRSPFGRARRKRASARAQPRRGRRRFAYFVPKDESSTPELLLRYSTRAPASGPAHSSLICPVRRENCRHHHRIS